MRICIRDSLQEIAKFRKKCTKALKSFLASKALNKVNEVLAVE